MITFSKLGRFGRLGNQMFQIASAMGIAKRNESAFAFPYWTYSRFFRYELPWISSKDISPRMRIHKEKTTNYYDVDLDMYWDWDLEGYFQSYKYFNKEYVEYYFDFLYPKETIPVTSIHIRRTDYTALQHTHPNLTIEDYYTKAMEYFPSNTKYMIFSDDISWCKECFGKPDNLLMYSEGKDAIDDLWLMSCCENNIIANSSFSWWAAYLNINRNKVVIAPKVWVVGEEKNDRIMEGWIII